MTPRDRSRVPYYWIVDVDGRTIEAYRLAEGQFRPTGRMGDDPGALTPFPDLTLTPETIWP